MVGIDIQSAKHIYFIGIGGIGMSALARYFLNQGINVSGYDRAKTNLISSLRDEGADIQHDDSLQSIAADIDFVVYTPAVPSEHKCFIHFKKHGIPLFKRSEILGFLSKEKNTIAVAGTHGKTSSCAMLSHLMHSLGMSPTAFVGGIMKNYNSNLLLGNSDWMVAEADEYDRSFLKLFPKILIITCLDPDHLDIYGDFEEMVNTYEKLCLQIQSGGQLITTRQVIDKLSDDCCSKMKAANIRIALIGPNEVNSIENVKIENGVYAYDLVLEGERLENLSSIMPGMHNIQNASFVITALYGIGVNIDLLKAALSTFEGIKRRFETVYKDDDFVLIDDYAHHPEELKAAISTARALFPDKKLTAIFQPHLYSRTRDFMTEFANELDKLDEVYLLPIYPAREQAIPGITSEAVFDIMKNNNGYIADIQLIITKLHSNTPEVLLTLGASDLDKYHSVILETILG